MYSTKNLLNIYSFILFAFIPVSILIGPAISIINILIISLSFLLYFLIKKKFLLIKDHTLTLLFVLYLYLILNSLFSIDPDLGLKRNLGFIRYILLFIAINYFFFKDKNFDNIFKIWSLIFLVVLFDVMYEMHNGENILGFVSNNKKRIVSFFKDEAVVGAYLNGFFFILIGFWYKNFEKKKKFEKLLIFSFIILATSCMIFTGERSNTLKFFFALTVFFYFNDKIQLNHKILFAISVIILK